MGRPACGFENPPGFKLFADVKGSLEQAEVASRCGHEAAAREARARATELAAHTECRMLVPSIHGAAATLAETLGDSKQRLTELREAQRLYEELGVAGHAERLVRELAALIQNEDGRSHS